MNYLVLIIAFFMAILDWVAVAKKWKRIEYVTKPGTMIALILWFGMMGGFAGNTIWFALGLVFSVAGDVFLMLPNERFIAGLISFLLAHIFYIFGFIQTPIIFGLPALVIGLLLIITSSQIYRRIAVGLVAGGNNKLKIPVLAYTTVITLMAFTALCTLINPSWNVLAALSASAGALLFYLSDTFLAWNKFVNPLPFARLRTMATYHLGQFLIIIGIYLQYLS